MPIEPQKWNSEALVIGPDVDPNDDVPAATGLANGGYAIAWNRLSGTTLNSIQLRLFDAFGAATTSAIQIVNNTGLGVFDPDVASFDSTGNIVVAYRLGAGDLYYAVRDASGGVVLAPTALASGVAVETDVAVARYILNGAETVLAVWEDASTSKDGSGSAIRGRYISSNGSFSGAEFLINTQTTGDQINPDVGAGITGVNAVVWTDMNVNSGDIKLRTYSNITGGSQITEITVNTTTTGLQDNAAVAVLSNGNIVVVWESAGAVFCRGFGPTGTQLFAEFQYGTGTEPQVAATVDGGFVLTYRHASLDGSGGTLRMATYDAAGARVGFFLTGNTTTLNDQEEADIAILEDGRHVVAFTDESTGTNDDVRLQIFDTRIQTITGGAGADTLVGRATGLINADDVIVGLDGNDSLYGLSGNDQLFGGDGADRLEGGDGNDVVDGGSGADLGVLPYTFGTGYTVTGSVGDLTIAGSAGTDRFIGVELFLFASGVTRSASEVLGVTDTVSNGTGTGATLAAGATVNGSIEQNDQDGNAVDSDFYRVTLTGGRQYTFTANAGVSSSDTLDAVAMILRDAGANGISATFVEGAAPSFTFTAPGTGTATYYLDIRAGGSGVWQDKTGAFTLGLVDNGPPAVDAVSNGTGTGATLAAGATVNGSIEQNDQDGNAVDSDFYRVTLTGGRQYTFTANAGVSSSDTLDAVAMLLRNSSASGISGTFVEGASPSFTFTAPGTGTATYYLDIRAGGSGVWQDKTGAFTLGLVDNGPPAVDAVSNGTGTGATLAAGATVNGSIEQNDQDGNAVDSDFYRVTLTGGRQYTFTANAGVSSSDTLDAVAMLLRDAGANGISATFVEGASPSFTFTAPGTGTATYYLDIRAGGSGAWQDKTGAYTLGLTDNGVAASPDGEAAGEPGGAEFASGRAGDAGNDRGGEFSGDAFVWVGDAMLNDTIGGDAFAMTDAFETAAPLPLPDPLAFLDQNLDACLWVPEHATPLSDQFFA